MSRIAKSPVELPKGVSVDLNDQNVTVKGGKGSLTLAVHNKVAVKQVDNILSFAATDNAKTSNALAGTTRALIANMVKGVSDGFERKLLLTGVGYRAKVNGNILSLTLGFSHPIDFNLPEGVSAETPTQTEILLKGVDKQLLGQTASEIRAFRPPEPYKGKGVRYAEEKIRRKDAKKK
ncbi:MAG: large subunit ribosomal protein L6 [Lentisphaeria bacterium]|jgi:large subunit ribosomal protein L6